MNLIYFIRTVQEHLTLLKNGESVTTQGEILTEIERDDVEYKFLMFGLSKLLIGLLILQEDFKLREGLCTCCKYFDFESAGENFAIRFHSPVAEEGETDYELALFSYEFWEATNFPLLEQVIKPEEEGEGEN